jgi:protein phosphatase
VKLVAGAFTDEGRLRDLNEDSHVIDERLLLFAIADGMGGHQGGEVASQTAIEALRAAVAGGRSINDAIELANTAVIERAHGRPELAGMGTTMTAVVVAGGRQLLVGHVGDSRAYLLHEGTLQRLTHDHSLVEELVRDGRLTPEQAESHPQRSIITRALGVDTEVDVDLYTVEVTPGDRVILCSDGLTTMVRERDVERIARAESDPQHASEALVDAANTAGGEDNITVVVLDVVEVDDSAAPDPEMLAAPEPVATPVPEPAPEVPEPPVKPPRASRSRRVRAVLFVLVPLVAIVAIGAAVLGWYARNSYYVGVADGDVVLYKGVPGGVLGWDPTVEERSRLEFDELTPIDQAAVADGAARGSRDKAESYLDRLLVRSTTTTTTTTTSTSTTSTTSTTLPATSTTAPVPPP